MSAYLYLYSHILKNRIKKALKKPVTYIFLIFILLYLLMIAFGFGVMIEEFHIDNTESLAVVLSVLVFFLIPSNLISYSRRKGLLFKKSDIHFIFPAPVNPKMILIFTGIRNLLINGVLFSFIAILGLLYFRAGGLEVLLYLLLFLVTENVVEGSMMILCYGNEKLPERFFKVLTVICYCLMAVFVIAAAALMINRGPSFGVIKEYLSLPVIQAIPVVGWNIAMIRLIFVGPTVLNMICTILFCLFTLALFLLAYRSPCVGEYFEDAAKFADDYAELKAKQNKGAMVMSMGKKKKFKNAEVTYKGTGAKAIFYRQLLEYKKSKFFIFGFNTAVSLIVGVGIAVLNGFADLENEMGVNKIFIIPAIMAYIIFIFSGYATKWSQELENPYTYLIPDSSFKKMWYSTKMEHIRAIADGALMTVPGAIAMGLTPLQAILIILLYVCLMANKLYYYMLADVLIGNTLGNVGRSLVKMLLQGIAIGIGAMAAVVGGIFLGIEAGFAIMILVMLIFTLLGALGAATAFDKMEVTA